MKVFILFLLLSLSTYVVAHKYETESANFKNIFLYYAVTHKDTIKIPSLKKTFSAYNVTHKEKNETKSPNFKHIFLHYAVIYKYEIENPSFKNVFSNDTETYKNGEEIFNRWYNASNGIQNEVVQKNPVNRIMNFRLCSAVGGDFASLKKVLEMIDGHRDLQGEDPLTWLSKNRHYVQCKRKSTIRVRETTSLFKYAMDSLNYQFIRDLIINPDPNEECHPEVDYALVEILPNGEKETLYGFLEKLKIMVRNRTNSLDSLHISERKVEVMQGKLAYCLKHRGQPLK